jgi:hypothetical protein
MKQPWPDMRWYPGVCLMGLRKSFSWDSQFPAQDLKPGCSTHEAGVLST